MVEGTDEADVETRFVDLDGTRIRSLVAGAGPPVVLLHGGGLDSASFSWKRALPALAEQHRVYALDWPGYGESDPPTQPPVTEYYVDVLERFLDAVELERAGLVGISMGGGIGLGFALRSPERVSRLVLVDSYGLGAAVPGGRLGALFARLPRVNELLWALFGRNRRLAAFTLRAVMEPENITPELVDDAYALLRRPNAGRAWREFQRNEVGFRGLRTNYLADLSGLAVPTLLVHGEHDPAVPVDWAVRAWSLVPDAEIEILGDCGHVPPRERPEAFNELVADYLAD